MIHHVKNVTPQVLLRGSSRISLKKNTTELRSPTTEARRCGSELDPTGTAPGVLLPVILGILHVDTGV